MLARIEREYLPSLPPLPVEVNSGLEALWEKSTQTQTEWVAAISEDRGRAGVVILGHQSEGSVTIPLVPITYSYTLQNAINDILEFSQEPDKDQQLYQGMILFLLPQEITLHPQICQEISIRNGLIVSKEKLLGIAHTHPLTNSISHLPSPHDLRYFIFGPLEDCTYSFVISGSDFSCLVKTALTPKYRHNPNWPKFRQNQHRSDSLDFEAYLVNQPEDIAFQNVLNNNCIKYHLGLYQGNLDTTTPLVPVFKN